MTKYYTQKEYAKARKAQLAKDKRKFKKTYAKKKSVRRASVKGEKRRAAKKRYYREGSFSYHGTGNANHKKPGLIPVRGIR